MLMGQQCYEMNTWMWMWTCDQEWIYLEYFDDMDRIFLKYLYAM
jgi:hypothetical protein